MGGSWNKNEAIGTLGANFALKYCRQLLTSSIISVVSWDTAKIKEKYPTISDEDARKKHLEGGDFLCRIISLGEDTNIILPFESAAGKEIVSIEGGIEIKTHTWGRLLSRNNDLYTKTCTIDFELWEESGPGWLQSLFDPQCRNRHIETGKAATLGCQPLILAYMYERKERTEEGGPRYFACIAFEDMDALKNRLLELKPDLWDFNNWDSIWKGKCKAKPEELDHGDMLLGRNWHIPFGLLEDIATVTMIDEDPIYTPMCTQDISTELFQERLSYIKRIANGRHLDTSIPLPTETSDVVKVLSIATYGKRPSSMSDDDIILRDIEFKELL